MHFRSKVVALLINCINIAAPIACGVSVFGPCFVLQYLMYLIILKSSWWKRASLLLYFDCLSDVL